MKAGVDIDRARAAKGRALRLISRQARVNGVGITRVGSGYGLKVNLSQGPSPGVSLPDEVDGVPLVVEVVGPISPRR